MEERNGGKEPRHWSATVGVWAVIFTATTMTAAGIFLIQTRAQPVVGAQLLSAGLCAYCLASRCV